jgi:hypothetical protein
MRYTTQLRNLSHHMRTTPTIAALSRDLYYAQNVFQRRPTPYMLFNMQLPLPTGRYCLMYPTPVVNAGIRYVEFQCDMNARAWQFLLQLVNVTTGLAMSVTSL